ncbi:hypothetical protein LSAT2_023063 [Lamellibrachia satsuma]|nr:hypothetical protein LSAT2_023063 [Lamellibrachia satsuma]
MCVALYNILTGALGRVTARLLALDVWTEEKAVTPIRRQATRKVISAPVVTRCVDNASRRVHLGRTAGSEPRSMQYYCRASSARLVDVLPRSNTTRPAVIAVNVADDRPPPTRGGL